MGPPLFWKLIKEDDEPGEDDVATKINIQLMKCCNCSKKFICWNNIKNVFEEEVATIIKNVFEEEVAIIIKNIFEEEVAILKICNWWRCSIYNNRYQFIIQTNYK